jgi:hypothetical protein
MTYQAFKPADVTSAQEKTQSLVMFIMLNFALIACSYVWSGLIVVLGIYLNVYSKNRAAWDARFREWFKRFFPQHRRLVALQNLQHVV